MKITFHCPCKDCKETVVVDWAITTWDELLSSEIPTCLIHDELMFTHDIKETE